MAIESHRRNKPYCMGTLYWQMNDCWPVASWAGMDYNGRWKALQYTVRSSFQDVLLSIDGTDRERIDVHVVSDLRTAVSAELGLTLYQFNGSVQREWTYPVELGADSVAIVFSSSVAELLEGQGSDDVLLEISLQADGQIIDRKVHYFVPEKEIPLRRSVITVTETPDSGGLSFTVTSDVLARGVYLTSEDEGIFSDNYFDLLPGQSKTIAFSQRGGAGRDWTPAVPRGLKVQSMVDFVSEDLLSI
jgi:beta-mannosidase